MRELVLATSVAALLLIAGCTVGPSVSTPAGSSPTSPPAEGSPTANLDGAAASATTDSAAPDSPTHGTTPATASPTTVLDDVTVEYIVRRGEIPEEFGSVTVHLQVVFVDDPADLGPCYPEVFSGPYKPTLTPLPTPSDDCHRSDPISIDLTEMDRDHSLGNFTGPGSTSGHAIVATEVSATYENGTSVTGIYGTGGAELVESTDRPDGSYGVRLGVGPARDDVHYSYWFLYERFDRTG